MMLLAPQYWLFEALLVFVVAYAIFYWFGKSRAGKRVAKTITMSGDDPQRVAEEVSDLKRRATEQLGPAERELAEAHETAETVRRAAGVPEKKC